MTSFNDYSLIKSKLEQSVNKEDAVSVNQRALIDKILARYASENTVLRELLQNADDAQAKNVTINYFSSEDPFTLENAAHIHNQVCGRLVVTNDGQTFSEEDWARLKRIAEGNPDETKIGAFGVGYYSVFSICESPLVLSGNQAMVFNWRENQLFAKRAMLENLDGLTSVVLEYREPAEIPDLASLACFLVTSLTFLQISTITLNIDGIRLLFASKLHLSTSNTPLSQSLINKTPGSIFELSNFSVENIQINCSYLAAIFQKPTSFSRFRIFNMFRSTMQEDRASTTDTSISLQLGAGIFKTSINSKFKKELERATKKTPPRQIVLKVCAKESYEKDDDQVFHYIFPREKSGKIFIGFSTQQTIGISSNLAASHIIPTVERDNIDLADPHIRLWNFELLKAASLVLRIIYDNQMSTLRSISDLELVKEKSLKIMRNFTFTRSTPNEKVSESIEESFFTCSKEGSILILTDRGICLSSKARISDGETFLKSIPLVQTSLCTADDTFIPKLIQAHILLPVSLADIKEGIKNEVLDLPQGRSLLKWAVKACSTKKYTFKDIHSVLVQAVINSGEVENGIVALSQIGYYLNASSIPPIMPLPSSCAPLSLTKSFSDMELRLLSWTELSVLDWAKFVCSSSDRKKNPCFSTEFAKQFLPIVSRFYEQANAQLRHELIDFLHRKSVIPTKIGNVEPRIAYLRNVKLFDDVPIMESIKGVKEPFLLALGLRRTVELQLVLEKLRTADQNVRWTSKTLITYLASVQDQLPIEDWEMLKKIPLVHAQDDKCNLRRIGELYTPQSEHRSLNLPIIDIPWEGAESNESKLLLRLGLLQYPTAQVLISIAQNYDDKRHLALNYFTQHFEKYNYAQGYKSIIHSKPFLPTKKHGLANPNSCYSNSKASCLNFAILESSLVSGSEKFGVLKDPTMNDCVNRFLNALPTRREKFVKIFEYFQARLGDIEESHLNLLRSTAFIPICDGDQKLVKLCTISSCFLITFETVDPLFSDIFPFVDFGLQANGFLQAIGCKTQPRVVDIGLKLCREASEIFRLIGTESYLKLLLKLADRQNELHRHPHLIVEMKRSPFLISETFNPHKMDARRNPCLARADEITVVDDMISYNFFRESILTVPQISALEEFYESLGSVKLSQLVQERPIFGRSRELPEVVEQLRGLIVERCSLFLHETNEVVSNVAKDLKNNLIVRAVESITLERRLSSINSVHKQPVTAYAEVSSKQVLLSITANKDEYDLGLTLSKVLLKDSKPASALLLASLISTDLGTLKNRGYNVDRILAAKLNEERLRTVEYSAAEPERSETIQPPKVVPPPLDGKQADDGLHQQNSEGLLRYLQKSGNTIRTALTPTSFDKKNNSSSTVKNTPPHSTMDPQAVENVLKSAMHSSRPENAREFQSIAKHSMIKEAKEAYCDSSVATHMSQIASVNGVNIFADAALTKGQVQQLMLHESDLARFSEYLIEIVPIFELKPGSINIFYDLTGPLIAFNRNGAIFCNFRFYQQFHQKSFRRDVLVYYWVVLCHEIAHNLVQDHSAAHSFYTESLIIHTTGKMMDLVQ